MNICLRAAIAGVAITLAGAGYSQERTTVQLSPAESREALDAAMRAAMAFELPPGLSRQQADIASRVIASLKRGDRPEALKAWGEFVDSAKAMGRGSSENIMATMFCVFRESIVDNNDAKKYFLSKLKAYNQISKFLSDYLKELAGASATLAGKDGTMQVGAVNIQGSGENIRVQRAPRRAMNLVEVRAESDLARNAAGSVDYEISKCQSLLRQDMAKDRELLKKLLDNLQDFEAETKKKMSDQRSRRPPP